MLMAAGDGLELFDAHCHLQVPSALRTPCPVAHCSERLLDQQATANVPAGPPTGALPAPRDGRGARRGRAALCGERLLGGRLGRGQQALPGVFLPCSLRSSVSHAHARAAQVGQLAADNADVVPNFGLHPWCAVAARRPAALCFAGALAMHEASPSGTAQVGGEPRGGLAGAAAAAASRRPARRRGRGDAARPAPLARTARRALALARFVRASCHRRPAATLFGTSVHSQCAASLGARAQWQGADALRARSAAWTLGRARVWRGVTRSWRPSARSCA